MPSAAVDTIPPSALTEAIALGMATPLFTVGIPATESVTPDVDQCERVGPGQRQRNEDALPQRVFVAGTGDRLEIARPEAGSWCRSRRPCPASRAQTWASAPPW